MTLRILIVRPLARVSRWKSGGHNTYERSGCIAHGDLTSSEFATKWFAINQPKAVYHRNPQRSSLTSASPNGVYYTHSKPESRRVPIAWTTTQVPPHDDEPLAAELTVHRSGNHQSHATIHGRCSNLHKVDNFHPTAVVSEDATLGADVSVGPFSVIGPNVRVGAGTSIGSHCVIGESSPLATGQLTIGERSLIRSHSVIYQGSEFGDELETGHHVVLREGLKVGRNLRAGSYSDFQGDSRIADYVRCHSGVFVSKRAVIQSYVWVFPQCALLDDPTPPSANENHQGVTLQEYAVVGAKSCIAPGVVVGENSFVAAGSMVTRNVGPGSAVRGNPAKAFGLASDILLRGSTELQAYPWTKHFFRGYPPEVIQSWRNSSSAQETPDV
jgi:acetyltransferase-like isoleucine patch superfamily enzyme